MIYTGIIFLIFILLFLYIPAGIILDTLKFDEKNDIFLTVGLRLITGFCLLTLLGFIIRLINIPYYALWFVPVISVITLTNKYKRKYTFRRISFKGSFLFITVVLLTGIVTQNLVLYRGARSNATGMEFPFIHDTMWNIALSNELFYHFPPQHPGLSGVRLFNNHYFYPLFLAITRSFTSLNINDIYFRLSPVLVSLLFGLSLYAVGSLLFKNRLYRGLAVLMGYFSGNAAYLVPLVLGAKFDWKGSTFYADQPFDQLVNPYSVLGFAIYLFGMYILYKIIKNKHMRTQGFLLALLFGSLYGFKSFGGIIAVISLTLFIPTVALIKSSRRILTLLFYPLTVFVPIFLFTTRTSSATLIFAPGWLLTEMVTSRDKFYFPHLSNIAGFYGETKNYLGLFKIKIIELGIYLVGNLGVRILGFLLLCKIGFNAMRRKVNNDSISIFHAFSLFSVVVSLGLPPLFNLGQNAYNIIQFTPYALVILAVYTVLMMERINSRYLNKYGKILPVVFIGVIFLLAIPVNVKNIMGKISSQQDRVSRDEVQALNYIKNDSEPDAVLLIDPGQFYFDPIYTSALSERRVYLASPDYARQTGNDPQMRLNEIKAYYSGNSESDFLAKKNITYILTHSHGSKKMQDYAFASPNIKIVFVNSTVTVFKVVNSQSI